MRTTVPDCPQTSAHVLWPTGSHSKTNVRAHRGRVWPRLVTEMHKIVCIVCAITWLPSEFVLLLWETQSLRELSNPPRGSPEGKPCCPVVCGKASCHTFNSNISHGLSVHRAPRRQAQVAQPYCREPSRSSPVLYFDLMGQA